MNELKGKYNESAVILMLLAFDYHIANQDYISKKDFMSWNFQERVEALKIKYETNLIECRESIANNLVSGRLTIEQRNQHLDMIEISTAIECTRLKHEGQKAPGPVLFKCFLHNDKTPSMSWSVEQHGFYCFGCSKDNQVFDLFDFIKLFYGSQGNYTFEDAFRLAVRVYVEDGDKIANPFYEQGNGKHINYIPYTKEMNRIRHWTFHYPIENDAPALQKLEERGISKDTAKRMAVMTWYPTIDNNPYGLCYWIFLNDDGSYTRRLATQNKNIYPKQFQEPQKWKNPKDKSIGIFNTRALEHCREFDQVCFVTESAIDAMSCEELGFHAIGLNSVSNLGKFFREYVDKQPHTILICLLDNDDAGKNGVDGFIKRKLFVPDYLQKEYCGYRWLSSVKDINEALVQDREETRAELERLEVEARKFYRSEV